MTINIALVSNENIVFGCDSVSSVTRALVDPFRLAAAIGKDGKPLEDANGNPTFGITGEDINDYVASVFSGVEKMFPVYEDLPALSVAATTAGMAAIQGQTVKALADEFRGREHPAYGSVRDVADSLLVWFRERYLEEFKTTEVPEGYWPDLNFLVGGVCNTQATPSLYRVFVKQNQAMPVFENGGTGIAWDGQADGVERLIAGFDSQLRSKIEAEASSHLKSLHAQWSSRIVQIVGDLMEKLGADELPEGVNTDLPALQDIDFPWSTAQAPVPYSSLPLQYAIDFIGFLVTAQSGQQRFTSGIATVGGRTHIGVMRKGYNFLMLNEPSLTHSMTGFSDDA
jgi:hypothetical protein